MDGYGIVKVILAVCFNKRTYLTALCGSIQIDFSCHEFGVRTDLRPHHLVCNFLTAIAVRNSASVL